MEKKLPSEQIIMGGLHARLKERTAPIHHDLESTGFATRLLAPQLEVGEYLNLLAHQLSFISPIETWFENSDDLKKYVPDLERRFKGAKLRSDITALGGKENLKKAEALDLPPMRNLAEMLGVLYVLEGSTLGGQLITKRLKQRPFINERNLNYYSSYGTATGAMWRAFLKSLSSFEADVGLEATAPAVPAAVATFSCLGNWFRSLSPA